MELLVVWTRNGHDVQLVVKWGLAPPAEAVQLRRRELSNHVAWKYTSTSVLKG